MNPIPASELVLNPDGSVYHLHLRPENIADTIIVVGDPDRVAKVSQHFETIEFQTQKREFVTHTGTYRNKRITVLSTGIGTDNVEIVMTELDALVNIDLTSRTIKPQHISLQIIRIGTSGSIQASIPVGSLVASVNAVGLDTLMYFYELPQTPQEDIIKKLLADKLLLGFQPYVASSSDSLLTKIGYDMIQGTTLTCPGFYAPQGRQIRAKAINPDYLAQLSNFNDNRIQLTNMEMETAGYYAFGRILGHEMISLSAILANRINNQFSDNPEKEVDELILKVLSRI